MTATRYQRRNAQINQMRSRRRRRVSGVWGLVVAGIVVIILGFFAFSAAIKSTEKMVDVKVNDKERVCDRNSDGGSECKYLVFTEQGTFKITDSIIYGNWRSSDVYGKIREDNCYTFKVVGWRLPFFSTYQNVVEVNDKAC